MSDTTLTSDQAAQLQREAQAWVVRLDSGSATSRDAHAFRRWCAQTQAHAQAFAQAREVWRALPQAARAMPAPSQTAPSLAWTRRAPANLGRRVFLGTALSAGVGYLLVRPPGDLWPAWSDMTADYRTATGEQRQVSLAGQVTVQMNTQTRFNVRHTAQAVAGIELLGGEAEVQMAPGRNTVFTVQAGSGQVRATAARFNVRHTDEAVCVTCLDGQIDLDYGGRITPIQASWQRAYDARGMGEARQADLNDVTAWRERRLVFNNVPLSQVITELNRYWPGRLVLMSEALGRSLVQAQFSLDRLSDATALIRDAYGAELTELPGGVVVLRSTKT